MNQNTSNPTVAISSSREENLVREKLYFFDGGSSFFLIQQFSYHLHPPDAFNASVVYNSIQEKLVVQTHGTTY